MATNNPVPNGETQDTAVNENENLETIGETTDQPVEQPGGPGTPSEQIPAVGGDATGGQPTPEQQAAAAIEKKEKSDVQKRIDTLTRRRYELEGRNEELEYELARSQRRLAAIERGAREEWQQTSAAPAAVDPNKPNRDNFSTYEDWVDAISLYNARIALAQRDQAVAQSQQSTAQTQVVERWNKNLETARGKYDDFDAVVGTDLKIPQLAFNAIVDSPVGTDVAYFLATHPEEAVKLASMSPMGVVRSIGRIEAKFDAPPAPVSAQASAPPPVASQPTAGQSARPQATQRSKPVVSQATAPVAPVGARSSTSTKNPDEMSFQEYKRWREETGRPSR